MTPQPLPHDKLARRLQILCGPTPQPQRKLLGGGHENRVASHTGSCERWREEAARGDATARHETVVGRTGNGEQWGNKCKAHSPKALLASGTMLWIGERGGATGHFWHSIPPMPWRTPVATHVGTLVLHRPNCLPRWGVVTCEISPNKCAETNVQQPLTGLPLLTQGACLVPGSSKLPPTCTRIKEIWNRKNNSKPKIATQLRTLYSRATGLSDDCHSSLLRVKELVGPSTVQTVTGRTLWRRHTRESTSTSMTNSVWRSSSMVGELRELWPLQAAKEGCSVSSDHLPRPKRPVSSGYVPSFRRGAARNTAPCSSTARLCGVPSHRNADTMVASKTNWAPWKSGRPSATTSKRLPSPAIGTPTSKSRTKTLHETRPPASLHTLATALSTANPPRPRTPEFAHAARWWPLESSGRPHRQMRETGGKGLPKATQEQNAEQLRVKSRMESRWRGREWRTRHVSSLWPEKSSLGLSMCPGQMDSANLSWTMETASRCHPCVELRGTSSQSSSRRGRTPLATSTHVGAKMVAAWTRTVDVDPSSLVIQRMNGPQPLGGNQPNWPNMLLTWRRRHWPSPTLHDGKEDAQCSWVLLRLELPTTPTLWCRGHEQPFREGWKHSSQQIVCSGRRAEEQEQPSALQILHCWVSQKGRHGTGKPPTVLRLQVASWPWFAQLDQHAALLILGSDRKPNPPNDNGKFATSHDSWEMSAPKIRVRHSFKETVWFTTYSSVCAGGNGSQEDWNLWFRRELCQPIWEWILLSMTRIPHGDILEGLHKSRIRESEKLKTVLELYDLETHQKILGPDYHRLKAMVKRSIEQEIRNKNFGSRNGNFETNPVV